MNNDRFVCECGSYCSTVNILIELSMNALRHIHFLSATYIQLATLATVATLARVCCRTLANAMME